MKNLKRIQYVIVTIIFAIILSNCDEEKIVQNNEDTTNSLNTNGKTQAEFNPNVVYGTMTDQDGNTYKTVTIGTQTWMAENLRTKKFRNGDNIPESLSDFTKLNSVAYCNYKNTRNPDTVATYGRLYNYFVVMDSRNVAPEGWHIPSYDEFKKLADYLGGTSVAGDKVREVGNKHFTMKNDAATNESGLTIIPSGYRDGNNSGFEAIGYSCTLYCSTFGKTIDGFIHPDNFSTDYTVHHINLTYSSLHVYYGISIRCVKD